MSGHDNDKAAFEARGELRDIRKRRLNTAIAEALGHPERSQMPPEPPTGYKLTPEERAEIAKLRVDLKQIKADTSKGDAEKYIDLQKTIYTAAASVLSSYEAAASGVAREKIGGEVERLKSENARLESDVDARLGTGDAQPGLDDVTMWRMVSMKKGVDQTMLEGLQDKLSTLRPRDKLNYIRRLDDMVSATGAGGIEARLRSSDHAAAKNIVGQLDTAVEEIEATAEGMAAEYAALGKQYEQAVSKLGVTGPGSLLQSLLSVGSEVAPEKAKVEDGEAPEEDALDIWLKTMADEQYDDHPVIIRDREDFYKDPRFQAFMEKYNFKNEEEGIYAPRQALTYLNQLVRENKAKSKKAGLEVIKQRSEQKDGDAAPPPPSPSAVVAAPAGDEQKALPTWQAILDDPEGWKIEDTPANAYLVKGSTRIVIPVEAEENVLEAAASGALEFTLEPAESVAPSEAPAAAPTAPPAGRPTAAAAKPKGVAPVKKEPESKETQEAPPDEVAPPEQASVASLSGVGEGVQSRPAELLTAVGPSSQKKRMEALKRRLQPSTIA